MGLIQAVAGSVGGVLADQWKEYFYCDAIPADVLVVKGKKRVTGRSSNNRGSDNVISSGSVICVADGQCMIIVEQGKIVEVCSTSGEFVFDASTEPSIFAEGLNVDSIMAVLETMGKRVGFGGEAAKDQRVYYFNTKEIMGNKYGTPSPIVLRVIYENIGLDTEISVRCFGEYSFRITNPVLFYTNVCGNVSGNYSRTQLEGQMRSELLTALQPALGALSESGIRYSSLPNHTQEIANKLNENLSNLWRDQRGIEIVNFGMSSLRADPEDEARLKEMQDSAALRNPGMAAAYSTKATAQAMKDAANNANGAVNGFMGMGMVGGMGGGLNPQALFQMDAQMQQAAAAAPAAGDSWQCSCGNTATGKFCAECGGKKPEPRIEIGWRCTCGAVNKGKFCAECGEKKPEEQPGWNCACGAVNQGKFCAECGEKKPAGAPQYKCDKCGWMPEDPTNPPKFCPECGDTFGDEDII